MNLVGVLEDIISSTNLDNLENNQRKSNSFDNVDYHILYLFYCISHLFKV